MGLPTSVLTKRQVKGFLKEIKINGKTAIIKVRVEYDDSCGNGHNTFSITGSMYETGYYRKDEEYVLTSKGKKLYPSCCGCIHDKIAKYFPELKHLIKWHLTSSDGPMYYKANSLYWKQQGNVDHMKKTIVFGAAPNVDTDKTPENMDDVEFDKYLEFRLPELIHNFKRDIENLGFVY